MHPANAAEEALQTYPADVRAYLAAFPPEAGLQPEKLTRDDPAAHAQVEAVERDIISHPGASAQPLEEGGRGWDIKWSQSAGYWFLYGHLYPTPQGDPDPTSPLLLINRSTLETIYGPELAVLARRILADALAWHELSARPFRA